MSRQDHFVYLYAHDDDDGDDDEQKLLVVRIPKKVERRQHRQSADQSLLMGKQEVKHTTKEQSNHKSEIGKCTKKYINSKGFIHFANVEHFSISYNDDMFEDNV